MLFHSYIFWGTIRKDSQFKIINDQANEIFADMGLDITHISYESYKYNSKVFRNYSRMNKKLINFNDNINRIYIANFVNTGKESDFLYEYEVEFGFINKHYEKYILNNEQQNDICYLTIKKDYLNDEFKLRALPKFKLISGYILDKFEYQHVTCKSRIKSITYSLEYQNKSYSKSINILEREIYK
ncbi:hypothetical protein [Bartonella sp. HY761]|uniref:hypothetical protein n=1 Tax=Bartonella sp. HY761 TaxID=2979330 RepID=UPI0021FC4A9D|nr:hypothetical protein [Bartonella sp. HY761]UXN06183.1 hypothetical protein N6A79_13000 [Bartonella sp. HY761]